MEFKLSKALKSGQLNQINKVFEMIYNQYVKLVAFNIGKYISDLETIQDLTQDVFVKFFDCAAEVKTDIKAYLSAMARNMAINYASKQNRLEQVDESLIVADHAPFYNQLLADLTSLLAPQEVDIIIKHCIEGYTFKEIAKQLGIGESNANVIYFRAIRKFKQSAKGASYEK